jgi:hypothetical protein
LGVAALSLVGFVVDVGAGPAGAADITATCTGTLDAPTNTFTLTADCGPVTAPLTVPDGMTIDGGGHTISATDAGGPQWNGGIVTNAGASMNIKNVTITGPATGFQGQCGTVMYGLYFLDASGTVDNVTVDHIFQKQLANSPSCPTGRSIRAEASPGAAAQTVDITNTTVMDYQKTGFEARGSAMTLNVSGSTAGPPHPLVGFIAQNGMTYVGASGRIANNPAIWGSGDQVPDCCTSGGGNTDGTAILLVGAHGVTVDHNTIVGPGSDQPDLVGTDIGVAVVGGSTDIRVSFNQIGRSKPDGTDDPTGFGVFVERAGFPAARIGEGSPRDVVEVGSEATLICNTFSGWNHNIVGAIQIDCTPLPNGSECASYSANAPNVEGGTLDANGAFVPPVDPITWEVLSGSLPPGLTMAADGTITGTPTQSGTFTFTVQATDSSDPPLTATTDLSITIEPDCTPPTDPASDVAPEAVSENGLPRTGSSTTPLFVGLLMVAAGAALVRFANRRRRAFN